jgi:hypothetical protein
MKETTLIDDDIDNDTYVNESGETTFIDDDIDNDNNENESGETTFIDDDVDNNSSSWEYDLSDGTLTLYDEDGNEVNSWSATSGPWGNGALPTGEYSMDYAPVDVPDDHPNQASYTDDSGNSWWVAITPQFATDRDGLGIHPDGNDPGTLGCIGATDNDTQDLRDALTDNLGFLTVVE